MFSLQNSFQTKTVAQTFSPEFSYHCDLSLSLNNGSKHTKEKCLAENLLHGKVIFEVWHKVVSKPLVTSDSSCEGVANRKLHPPPAAILLGTTEVALSELIEKRTGSEKLHSTPLMCLLVTWIGVVIVWIILTVSMRMYEQ